MISHYYNDGGMALQSHRKKTWAAVLEGDWLEAADDLSGCCVCDFDCNSNSLFFFVGGNRDAVSFTPGWASSFVSVSPPKGVFSIF